MNESLNIIQGNHVAYRDTFYYNELIFKHEILALIGKTNKIRHLLITCPKSKHR